MNPLAIIGELFSGDEANWISRTLAVITIVGIVILVVIVIGLIISAYDNVVNHEDKKVSGTVTRKWVNDRDTVLGSVVGGNGSVGLTSETTGGECMIAISSHGTEWELEVSPGEFNELEIGSSHSQTIRVRK